LDNRRRREKLSQKIKQNIWDEPLEEEFLVGVKAKNGSNGCYCAESCFFFFFFFTVDVFISPSAFLCHGRFLFLFLFIA
jgi:hypothetical protein